MSEGTSSAPPSKRAGAPLSYVWGLQYERGQRSSSSHKNDAKCTRCGIVLLSATVFQAEEHILQCADALEENKEAVHAARAKKAGDVVPALPDNSLASKLYTDVLVKQQAIIKAAEYITFSMDGYTTSLRRSLFAGTADTVTSSGSRRAFVVDCADMTKDRHTAEAVAGGHCAGPVNLFLQRPQVAAALHCRVFAVAAPPLTLWDILLC